MRPEGFLFGTDGVRGFAFGDRINPISCTKLAIAFALFLSEERKTADLSHSYAPPEAMVASGGKLLDQGKKGSILVAYDSRESCLPIYHAIVSGVTGLGFDLLDGGLVHVGALSAGTVLSGAMGGIMISASHNKHHDNGLKFFNGNGQKISSADQSKMLSLFRSLESGWSLPFAGIGSVNKYPLGNEYAGLVKQSALLRSLVCPTGGKLLKVVIDCANGAACGIAPDLFKHFSFEATYIGIDPNGKNINLDCGVTSPDSLSKAVVAQGADIGICFDGDGDRLLVVDENGVVIEGERLIAFLANNLYTYVLSDNDLLAKSVVTTVASNSCLERFLRDKGFKVFLSEVGDRAVFQKMVEEDSFIGGEESGHIIVKTASAVSDGVFNAIAVLLLLSASGMPTSIAMASPLPTPYKKFDVDCGEIVSPMQKSMFDRLQGRYLDVLRRKSGPDTKLLVRPSGTEAKIRVYMESDDADFLDELAENLKSEIAKLVQPC